MTTVEAFAETSCPPPIELMPWMAECSSNTDLSKTLFLLFLQSLPIDNKDHDSFSRLFKVCFPVLKQQWSEFESAGVTFEDELTVEKLDRDCTEFLSQLSNPPKKSLNANLLVCIFWRLLNSVVSVVAKSDQADKREWLPSLHDLFLIFATPCLKHVLRGQFHLLLMKHNISIASLLSKYFTEEGVSDAAQEESLLCIAATCSQLLLEKDIGKSLELLLSLPFVLVPLSSENQVIRTAAMTCIEGLDTLRQHVDTFVEFISLICKLNMKLLVDYFCVAKDELTYNGVFSLLLRTFKILTSEVTKMDSLLVKSNGFKILEGCLLALDLRRKRHESFGKIHILEDHVIETVIALFMSFTDRTDSDTMVTDKLIENLFRQSLVWVGNSLDRTISFYRLVSKLLDQYKSSFVPYLKLLAEGCVLGLTSTEENGAISSRQWHLRELIISSLHKMFMYDLGSLKVLDASHFQLLLNPLVRQLVVEPPSNLQEFPDVPSVEKVNDALVACLRQMAINSASGPLRESLERKVRAQKRSGSNRAKSLARRVLRHE